MSKKVGAVLDGSPVESIDTLGKKDTIAAITPTIVDIPTIAAHPVFVMRDHMDVLMGSS